MAAPAKPIQVKWIEGAQRKVDYFCKKVQENFDNFDPTAQLDAIKNIREALQILLEQKKPSDGRINFFRHPVLHIKKDIDSNEPRNSEALCELAARSQRAAVRFCFVLLNPRGEREPLPSSNPMHCEQVRKSLEEKDKEALRNACLSQVKTLSQTEVDALLLWAMNEWEKESLCALLAERVFSKSQIESIATKAVKKGVFDQIAEPFFLFHFHLLGSEIKETVETWTKRHQAMDLCLRLLWKLEAELVCTFGKAKGASNEQNIDLMTQINQTVYYIDQFFEGELSYFFKSVKYKWETFRGISTLKDVIVWDRSLRAVLNAMYQAVSSTARLEEARMGMPEEKG